MSVCLIAIFKNESHILKEWITHYIAEGVDRFLLIDNGSSDDYMAILDPYIRRDLVKLVRDETRYEQVALYNKYYLEESKKYDWAIVCDLDEFIYSRNGFKTIKEYLNTLNPSISQVMIPWKIFGSNGYIEQPTSVVKSFTKRVSYTGESTKQQGVIVIDSKKYSLCKTIVRTKYINKYSIHTHYTTNENKVSPNETTSKIYDVFANINKDILNSSYLQLNHYCIQSYSWFMKVKATRGDVSSITIESIRDTTYFKEYDINDTEDLELSLKKRG